MSYTNKQIKDIVINGMCPHCNKLTINYKLDGDNIDQSTYGCDRCGFGITNGGIKAVQDFNNKKGSK